MKGRKIIPIGIKKAKGTYRKDREKIVPDTSEKLAQPPANLNPRANHIFQHMVKNRLCELGLASASYTEILALLCSRMAELEILDKFIDENGFTYKARGEGGVLFDKIRPEIAMQKDAARHVHSLLTEFGLTPASAQKVGVKKEKKEHNEFDDI